MFNQLLLIRGRRVNVSYPKQKAKHPPNSQLLRTIFVS